MDELGQAVWDDDDHLANLLSEAADYMAEHIWRLSDAPQFNVHGAISHLTTGHWSWAPTSTYLGRAALVALNDWIYHIQPGSNREQDLVSSYFTRAHQDRVDALRRASEWLREGRPSLSERL